MDDKQADRADQIQAKLKTMPMAATHTSAGQPGAHQGETESADRAFEITVASQRDAFDLPACRKLLDQHGITSELAGRGFNQVVVVSRDHSSQAIDLLAAHREQLLRVNPLSAGDYVIGVLAWSFGCGLAIPALSGLLLLYLRVDMTLVIIVAGVLLAVSLLLGGVLGYFRCRSIANRKRRP